MTESDIQDILFAEYRGRGHEPIVPNIKVFGWEADLVTLTKAGYANEFEVKISVGDYKADFTKYKHRRFTGDPRIFVSTSGFTMLPSHFWYVVPAGLIEESELPEYAGLLWVRPSGQVEERRSAPRIHSVRLSENQIATLHRGLMLRYWRRRLGQKKV